MKIIKKRKIKYNLQATLFKNPVNNKGECILILLDTYLFFRLSMLSSGLPLDSPLSIILLIHSCFQGDV